MQCERTPQYLFSFPGEMQIESDFYRQRSCLKGNVLLFKTQSSYKHTKRKINTKTTNKEHQAKDTLYKYIYIPWNENIYFATWFFF